VAHSHFRRALIVSVPLLFAVILVPLTARGAVAKPRVSETFSVQGRKLTVHGTVRPAVSRWRALLEQQRDHDRWVIRASVRVVRHRSSSSFLLRWPLPTSTRTLVVRIAMVSGHRTVWHSEIKRLKVAAPGTGNPTKHSGTTSCGGEVPPRKPDGDSWSCTFDDEFDSTTGDATALNTSWWIPQVTANSGYTTGPATDVACYENSPQNISVSGGALHLTVRKVTPFLCDGLPTEYTAGMVSTYERFTQTYGRFEVRALLPQATAKGLQETLWLWPANDTKYGKWPASGEVDFAEFYSQYPTLDIPYIHYDYNTATVDPKTHTNTVTADSCKITLSQYNDYAVVWTPGSFTITVNGNTCLIDNYVADGGLTAPEPFNQPFFIALTQALGVDTNAFNPATTPLPATTSIQYVRVWK
jgi:beta-glucanase (GH16 family)